MEEYNKMDLNRPGQITDWAIREGASPIPSQAARWDWVLERRDVIFCNPGPNNEIKLKPITLDGDNAGKKKKRDNARKKNTRG